MADCRRGGGRLNTRETILTSNRFPAVASFPDLAAMPGSNPGAIPPPPLGAFILILGTRT
jgi:hypothetical protein